MAITDWPADERPREKLLLHGAETLSDAELLAIFLRTGVTGLSAVDLARNLLTEFEGLRPLLEADRSRFCAVKGLGSAKYAQLQAVLEMARRHLRSQLKRAETFTDPKVVRDYLSLRLRHLQHEIFLCLWLDNQHQLIASETLAQGSISGASVYPREIVKAALRHNAVAVIVAHNHPSGVAEPSSADRHLTSQLKAALNLIEVRLLDHFIIGEGEPVSFAERGLL